MQEPLEEDFNRISKRSSHEDLYEIMQGHLEDLTRTLQDLLSSQGPVQDHAKASDSFQSSSRKDLYKSMYCKHLLDDFTIISTRSSHKEF